MGWDYEEYSKEFKNMTVHEIKFLIKNEVQNSNSFKQHVQEVSLNTKIHPEIVHDVLINYFTNILIVINRVRKIKTKINVYGFFSLFIKKGNRI